MSRPQGVHAGSSAGNRIDATLCAHAGTTLERHFTLADLPRLRDAGARDDSAVDITFGFSQLDAAIAIDGALKGTVVLTCQRCMQPLQLPLSEVFRVVVVQDEAELDQEPSGYEAILGDPVRLDLQALTEDQVLLALPLIPRHEAGQCPGAVVQSAGEPAVQTEDDRQRPFGNLRDLLRTR